MIHSVRMVRARVLLAVILAGCLGLARGAETVEVSIEGVQGELLNNVRALLGLERNRDDLLLSPELVQRLHRQAPAEIGRALEPFGYYRPEIETELLPPDAANPAWRARYRVQPGEPVQVRELSLKLEGAGAADTQLEPVTRAFPLGPGAVLEHRLYEQGKRKLLEGVRREGYLDAKLVESRVQVQLEPYQADIRIRLETGPLYRFGPVSFEQEGFDEEYLRRFITFRTGERYTRAPVTRLRHALGASGHFERVEIERLPAQGEQHLTPLLVRLQTFKPNRYRARIGWGTDTGFGLHGDWYRRFLGESGHQMRVGTVLVQERAKFVADIDYSIPLDPLEGTRIELFARHQGKDLDYEEVELNEGGSTRILDNTLGIKLPRPRRLWGGLEMEERIGITWLTETYDVFDVLFGHYPELVQEFIAESLGEGRDTMNPSFNALVPSIEWTYRDRDDALYATRGNYLYFGLKGALEGFGSNLTFWQARLRGAHIRPLLGEDRLILRTDLAYTAADTEQVLGITFNQMPELYEFRTGGDRSVRGYAYETLYPEDSITGGRHLMVASIEYEKTLYKEWSAAVFLDAGNAFQDFSEPDLHLGVGVGARWRSPVGLVRLDLAYPLSEPEDGFRIHFAIGPEF